MGFEIYFGDFDHAKKIGFEIYFGDFDHAKK